MVERGVGTEAVEVARGEEGASFPGLRVCMHVPGTGRTDVRVRRSAEALRKAGCAITVVDIEHDETRPEEENLDGIHFRHVHMPKRLEKYYQPVGFARWIAFKVTRILRGALAVVKTDADVYHAHDVIAIPSCYLAAKLRRKPLIYDAHELPLVDPHQTQHRIVWWVSTRLVRMMLPGCTAVITVSPLLVRELQQRYGGPRATVVRNIPPYQAPVESDRLRSALGLDAESGIALYQGNFQLDRGLDVLIEAARYLAPQHRIVLMGKDLTQGYVPSLVEKAGVGNRVKLLPPVPHAQLLEWTASADLGLIVYRADFSPNVRYCLPNKIFEYLMAGVPVLASPLDAVADLLRTYDVGEVVPSIEPEQVGRTINALLDDQQTRQRMRRNALAAAQRELCWEEESRQLVRVYQQVAPAAMRAISSGAV